MVASVLNAPENRTAANSVQAISAGSNRLVLITVCMYNGAGSATPPTSVTVNGVSGILLAGDNAANTRVAANTWLFKETDIATISGQTISTAGQSGTVKSIVVMSLQDATQVTPTAVNKAYLGSSGTLTLGLTRAANSFTVLFGYTSTNSQAMNMANPSRDGSINFSNGTFSYGYENDSAQTVDSTIAGSNFTTGHVINFEEAAPVPSITSIDGDATPTIADEATDLDVVTANMSDIVSGTLDGRDIVVNSVAANACNIDFPLREDGMVWGELPATKTLTLVDDADDSADISVDITLQTDEAKVIFSSADTSNSRFVAYAIDQLGYSVADGVQLYYPTLPGAGDLVINPDSSVEITQTQTVLIWHCDPATDEWNSFNLILYVDESVASRELTGLTLSGNTLEGQTLQASYL